VISTLAAVRLTRRLVSIAIFRGLHLEYVRARNLYGDANDAAATVAGFLGWAIAQFDVEAIAFEDVAGESRARVPLLAKTVIDRAASAGLPCLAVHRREVFDSFGHPPLHTRSEVQSAAIQIWPALAMKGNKPLNLEAAALGLYVQVDKLLNAALQ
jgi:hypothetical protein